MVRKVYRTYEEPWIKVLSLGLMASIVGLLFQAVGVNTFIKVRIMESFWFLAAPIMALHRGIRDGGKEGPDSTGGSA